MNQVIRKFKIDVMPHNVHPFHDENPYRVSQHISLDGGRSYQSQGIGTFFKNENSAREFIESEKVQHPQDIIAVDDIEYIQMPKANIRFVIDESNQRQTYQRYRLTTNISFDGGRIYQPLGNDVYFSNPQDINTFINDYAKRNPMDRINVATLKAPQVQQQQHYQTQNIQQSPIMHRM